MTTKKKYDFCFHNNDAMTKIQLKHFLGILKGVCRTKDDIDTFVLLLSGIQDGNVIPNGWMNTWRGKYRLPGKVDAILQKMAESNFLRFKYGVGAILNPTVIMHGIIKADRKELKREYASLSDKPFDLYDKEYGE